MAISAAFDTDSSILAPLDAPAVHIADAPKTPLLSAPDLAVKLKPNEEELDLSHVLESAGLAVGHCGADALPKLKLANGFVEFY